MQTDSTPGAESGRPLRTLPKDVYPDSRNRLPLAKREDLDEEGKRAYDAAVSNQRSLAGLQGPAGIRLSSGTPTSRKLASKGWRTPLLTW